MKKLGNKFIIGVIIVITIIIASQVFIAFSHSNRDTNSYLSLIVWNAMINENRLESDTKVIVSTWDRVRVIWESSLALIEWWDGSMTRLGWNTSITIEQSDISNDYTDINISFDLLAGKTWSHIVSFIGSDSSFTQSFDGIEAWVRGTVFDVDLDRQFIHSSDHSVAITTPEGDSFLLPEGQAMSLESFSLIEFSQYISELRDTAWTDVNTSLDREYINTLSENLRSSMQSSNPFLFLMRFFSPSYATLYVLDTYEHEEDVENYLNSLSESKKQEVYPNILSVYQKMNFVSPDSWEYERKMRYKSALVTLDVNPENSQRLVAVTGYDLQDIIDSGNSEWLTQTLEFINSNVDWLNPKNLNILKWWLDYIPEWLLEEFSENFNSLWDILNIDFNSLQDINSRTIGDVLDSTDNAIQNFLDENVGWLLDQLSN